MIKILWLVLFFLVIRQVVRLGAGLQQRMRAKSMPRSESADELDIAESDIIDAEFTEVSDEPVGDARRESGS